MTTPKPELTPEAIAHALAQARESAHARTTHSSSPAREALAQALAEVQATHAVAYQWPLVAQIWLDWPRLLIDRLVRRYLCWYLGRIVAQQNAANETVGRALELLAQRYDELS
jgi:hypothetical protein